MSFLLAMINATNIPKEIISDKNEIIIVKTFSPSRECTFNGSGGGLSIHTITWNWLGELQLFMQ
ncbi:hypothetical protein [Gracilibacillus suaedae]|uniref:hypothetical protein n=1 Tax=Gracilibacillus suaedae TaxID=2820273 RepID=UPI001ABE2BC6|nr:hypothetical protein [Gracilibacillus suaedae]